MMPKLRLVSWQVGSPTHLTQVVLVTPLCTGLLPGPRAATSIPALLLASCRPVTARDRLVNRRHTAAGPGWNDLPLTNRGFVPAREEWRVEHIPLVTYMLSYLGRSPATAHADNPVIVTEAHRAPNAAVTLATHQRSHKVIYHWPRGLYATLAQPTGGEDQGSTIALSAGPSRHTHVLPVQSGLLLLPRCARPPRGERLLSPSKTRDKIPAPGQQPQPEVVDLDSLD